MGVAHNDPIFVKIGPKKTIFKTFYQLFFRTAGLQQKLLILIKSPNTFHWKSAKKSKVGVVFGKIGAKLGVQCHEKNPLVFQCFFSDSLHEVYIYKQDIVVIEIPEWKLKAKLARNTILEGN